MIGKLGRAVTPQHKRGGFWLGRYLPTVAYDIAPAYQPVLGPVKHELWGNDEISNCCYAGLAKIIAQRCALLNQPCKLTTDDVIAAYSAVTGYNPRDPSTDQGGNMLDAIRYGIEHGIGPYKFTKQARVNVLDRVELRAAIWGFGSAYVGANLPLRINEQMAGGHWYIPPHTDEKDRERSLGGHAFAYFGAERGKLAAYPWGVKIDEDDAHAESYCDESYIIMDDLWATQMRLAPNGFDYDRLMHDMTGIGAPL